MIYCAVTAGIVEATMTWVIVMFAKNVRINSAVCTGTAV